MPSLRPAEAESINEHVPMIPDARLDHNKRGDHDVAAGVDDGDDVGPSCLYIDNKDDDAMPSDPLVDDDNDEDDEEDDVVPSDLLVEVVREETDEDPIYNTMSDGTAITKEYVQEDTSKFPFATPRQEITSGAPHELHEFEPLPRFRPDPTAALSFDSHSVHFEPLPGDKKIKHTRLPAGNISWGPSATSEADRFADGVLSIVGVQNLEKVKWFTVEPGISPYSCTESIPGNTGEVSTVIDRGSGWVQRPERILVSQTEVDRKTKDRAVLRRQLGSPGQFTRPTTLYKIGSHRPPPSTPPELVATERLSMPTLPTLFSNTVPHLLEQYKNERAIDPTLFDKNTREIQDNLISAKIERGGSARLLRNEYSAELAGRLDAEIVSRWEAAREHRFHHEGGSDDKPATGSVPDNDAQNLDISRDTLRMPDSTTEAEDPSDTMYVMPLGFRLSDHVRKVTNLGSVKFQQTERVEKIVGQHTKVEHKTWIEITEEFTYHDEDELSWQDVVDARRQKEAREQKERADTSTDKRSARDDFPDLDANSVEARLSDVLRALANLKGFNEQKELDPKLIQLANQMDERIWQLKATGELRVHQEGER